MNRKATTPLPAQNLPIDFSSPNLLLQSQDTPLGDNSREIITSSKKASSEAVLTDEAQVDELSDESFNSNPADEAIVELLERERR